MKSVQKDEGGFGLIELLVALPIAALVVAAATGAIFQILNSAQARSDMVAYREVQTAGYWISNDTLMAQNVTPGSQVNAGFPLTLSWTDWDGGEHHIVYTLEPMPSSDLKYLQRQGSVNSTVGRYIYVDADPAKPTNCVWDEGEKVLIFTVKVQIGQQIATRTYEVKPRPFC